MAKKKKEKHLIGKKEFLFNFFSILVMLGVGLYFGGRSFYYYSKQNITMKEEEKTLNGLIIHNNSIVTNGDGLYRNSDGYYFKGKVGNNYVRFGNRLFRVIQINEDNTVRVVSDDLVASFMWGEDSNYQTSNLREWLTDTGNPSAGVYYQTIPNIEKFLKKTEYRENHLKNNKIIEAKKKYKDYVTTLSIDDYVLANGKSSYLNNGKIYYLLGYDEENKNLYVDDDGSIQSGDSLDGYGVRAVFTFKKNLNVKTGDGTVNNPYVIDQGNDVNYIDSYVRLGTDTYKVYQESNTGVLKMYRFGYALENGVEIARNYSKTTSLFDLTDKNNIAYYLNTTYLNSLSYAHLLVDNYFFTGEVSTEMGYHYRNIYQNQVVCKVGLLNIFDYVSNNSFNDYFHMNTTSSVGGIQYSTYSNGLLEEVDVTEIKHFVPVVSIQKASIKAGDGTMNNPYIAG